MNAEKPSDQKGGNRMLDYCFDLSPNSFSRIYTPGVTAKSLPRFMTEQGYYEAGPKYYTRQILYPAGRQGSRTADLYRGGEGRIGLGGAGMCPATGYRRRVSL